MQIACGLQVGKTMCSNPETQSFGNAVQLARHLLQSNTFRRAVFVFCGLPFCEACGWSALEQLAEVQVLRLTMELALARAEAGDTCGLMVADDHCLQEKGTFWSQFLMRVMKL